MHPALQILSVPTAPGHEGIVAEFVRDWLRTIRVPFREDAHGNLIAKLHSPGAPSSVAFSVHMDHPGFEVLRSDGRHLEAAFLGGVPRAWFRRGVPVEFFDDRGKVIALAEVVRVMRWDRRQRRIRLRVKSGFTRPGAFGMWKLSPLKLNRARTHVVSRVCDDLAGCAAVLAMLAELAGRRAKVRVTALFTRREEIGLEGAFEVAAEGALPRSTPVISIETSKALASAPQGAGPIARVGDRSSVFDPAVTQRLCVIAQALQKKDGFRSQRKLMDGGTCEATAYLERGYRAGGLCVALGNYHNCAPKGRIAAENIHLDDWHGLVKWMVATAREFSK